MSELDPKAKLKPDLRTQEPELDQASAAVARIVPTSTQATSDALQQAQVVSLESLNGPLKKEGIPPEAIETKECGMMNCEMNLIRMRFRQRIDSLESDTKRCFWDIKDPGAPGCAYFPPVMYAFATIDYFSSYWAGWNQGRRGKNQTDRMTDFMNMYLLYPRKNSQIAINFWRHKLMHTAEPRILRNSENDEVYKWKTGINLEHHMILVETGVPNEFRLEFDPLVLVRDLREGVFGPKGYFQELRTSSDLQKKYCKCFKEMNSYKITLRG